MTEPNSRWTTEVEIDARGLGRLRKIGSGGQGTVYELVDQPEYAYKEYSPRVVDDVDVAALGKFVHFIRDLDEDSADKLISRAAWPVQVVRKDGVVQGFIMRRAPEEFSVEMSWVDGRSSVLGQVQFLLNSNAYLEDRDLEVSDQFRLQFIRDTAHTLAMFHELGITVGDLSPNNLLFAKTKPPQCFFIDCDAMRLGEDTVLEQVETPEWRVAELGEEELATPASDSHKLGLLTIRLFAGDQHSRDPDVVPRRLRRVVIRSLYADPAQRPMVREWDGPIGTLLRPAAYRASKPKQEAAAPEPTASAEPAATTRPPVRPTPLAPPTRPAPSGWRRVAIQLGGPMVVVLSLIFIFSRGDNQTPSTASQSIQSPNTALYSAFASYQQRYTPPVLPPRLGLPTLGLNISDYLKPSGILSHTCILRTVDYAKGVAENTKASAALHDFNCAVQSKDIGKLSTDKDSNFAQRFGEFSAAKPGFMTITGISVAAKAQVKTTVRFPTNGGTTCHRTTFTLKPTADGYEVFGLTALVKTTGCG